MNAILSIKGLNIEFICKSKLLSHSFIPLFRFFMHEWPSLSWYHKWIPSFKVQRIESIYVTLRSNYFKIYHFTDRSYYLSDFLRIDELILQVGKDKLLLIQDKESLNDWKLQGYRDKESIQRYKQTIEDLIESCDAYKQRVISMINRIEDPLIREVFFLRFVYGKTQERIALEVRY